MGRVKLYIPSTINTKMSFVGRRQGVTENCQGIQLLRFVFHTFIDKIRVSVDFREKTANFGFKVYFFGSKLKLIFCGRANEYFIALGIYNSEGGKSKRAEKLKRGGGITTILTHFVVKKILNLGLDKHHEQSRMVFNGLPIELEKC